MNMPTIPKAKKPRAKKPVATYPSSDRVYMAGCALSGLLACSNTKGNRETFAGEAVRYADDTLAKLKEPK